MRLRATLTLALILGGTWQTASGLYIPAKAWLAQVLIHRAWAENDSAKPWPWADMKPVARLVVPDHNQDFIVLSGASGEALAFGPGHLVDSYAPGSGGHIVIGGHRDTHFRFLKNVVKGQLLQLQSKDGLVLDYYIESMYIADTTTQPLILNESDSLLTLVTCYPFDAISATNNKRYVVVARPI